MQDQSFSIQRGGAHSDQRGILIFFNDFDMSLIKRFYIIGHHDTMTVRGWRGHKTEQRWFHVLEGAFSIQLVKIDNFEQPSPELEKYKVILSREKMEVLHIPAGFATTIQALEQTSRLLVFADHGIDHARFDDYLYALDYFETKQIIK